MFCIFQFSFKNRRNISCTGKGTSLHKPRAVDKEKEKNNHFDLEWPWNQGVPQRTLPFQFSFCNVRLTISNPLSSPAKWK